MKIYNTKTQTVEDFEPLGSMVKMYVCGITPYDTTHLGHAFTYTSYDLLIRYLESEKGLQVRYVQNVTDVDDDILKRAAKDKENWQELGNRWTNHYIDDMIRLNVRPPDELPRATDVVHNIMGTVQNLIEAGVAYEVNGNVYYSVDAYPGFGKLSHLPREEMLPIANERGNFPEDPNKRDPLDFVLWQASKPGEPAWQSLWGPGRPGWHIECSTLATKYLGDTIDIHGGGVDLCFPHHECEIAQVVPITKHGPFVRYWMHTAMVRYDGEKMSKSLGNLVMVDDLLKTYTPNALRMYLGSHHYRDPWSYDEKDLKKAAKQAETLEQAARVDTGTGEELSWEIYAGAFTEAMDNDLYSPAAEAAMLGLAQAIIDSAKIGRHIHTAQKNLIRYANMFGMRLLDDQPSKQVVKGWEKFKRK